MTKKKWSILWVKICKSTAKNTHLFWKWYKKKQRVPISWKAVWKHTAYVNLLYKSHVSTILNNGEGSHSIPSRRKPQKTKISYVNKHGRESSSKHSLFTIQKTVRKTLFELKKPTKIPFRDKKKKNFWTTKKCV